MPRIERDRLKLAGCRSDNEFTKILAWPGYPVYQHEIDEKAKTLKLWIRRKRGNRKIECSGLRTEFTNIYDTSERALRDLPWSAFTGAVWVEVYRSARDLLVPLLQNPYTLDHSLQAENL